MMKHTSSQATNWEQDLCKHYARTVSRVESNFLTVGGHLFMYLWVVFGKIINIKVIN